MLKIGEKYKLTDRIHKLKLNQKKYEPTKNTRVT